MTSRRKSMIVLQGFFQADDARLPVHQRQHVDEEGGLHGGVLDRGYSAPVCGWDFPLELDDDAHALPVGLIAQVADAVDFLVFDQVGDVFDEGGLVDLVRQLADDNLASCPCGDDAGDMALARTTILPWPVA